MPGEPTAKALAARVNTGCNNTLGGRFGKSAKALRLSSRKKVLHKNTRTATCILTRSILQAILVFLIREVGLHLSN